MATLPGAIGSVLGLVGPVSVYCDWVRWKIGSATSTSVWQHRKIVWADPSLRYTRMLQGRYATNKQQQRLRSLDKALYNLSNSGISFHWCGPLRSLDKRGYNVPHQGEDRSWEKWVVLRSVCLLRRCGLVSFEFRFICSLLAGWLVGCTVLFLSLFHGSGNERGGQSWEKRRGGVGGGSTPLSLGMRSITARLMNHDDEKGDAGWGKMRMCM